jgi:hypothetical protein
MKTLPALALALILTPVSLAQESAPQDPVIWTLDLGADSKGGGQVVDLDGDGRLDCFLVCGRGYSGELEDRNRGRAYAIRLGTGRGPGWQVFRGDLRQTGAR